MHYAIVKFPKYNSIQRLPQHSYMAYKNVYEASKDTKEQHDNAGNKTPAIPQNVKTYTKKDYMTPGRNEERKRAPLSAIGTICDGTTYIHSKM